MAWAEPVNMDPYKYLSTQFGFRPPSNNLGESLSLRGYYKTYYCHIRFPLIVGDAGPQLAHAIFHINLNESRDIYLRINPREYIYSSKNYYRKETKAVSNHSLTKTDHDVFLDLIKYEKQASSALYLIEVEGNNLYGYLDISQSENDHVISSLNFLVNFAHKLDWNKLPRPTP